MLDYDPATRRYSLHQTVQAFFAARLTNPLPAEHHATYYVELMARCNLEAQHESTVDAALAMLDREIGQMERGQQWAVQSIPSSDQLVVDYAFACGTFFDLRGHYDQEITWLEAGRAVTQRQHRIETKQDY